LKQSLKAIQYENHERIAKNIFLHRCQNYHNSG